jgi:stage III sporulation protein AD
MADIFKVIGIGFIATITAALLKGTKPELSFAVMIVSIIVILSFVIDMLRETMSVFLSIAEIAGVESSLLKLLLKIVGVGYLTEFGSGILTDFGSNSIADKVTLAGKITIVLLSMPVVESLLRLISEFLQLV